MVSPFSILFLHFLLRLEKKLRGLSLVFSPKSKHEKNLRFPFQLSIFLLQAGGLAFICEERMMNDPESILIHVSICDSHPQKLISLFYPTKKRKQADQDQIPPAYPSAGILPAVFQADPRFRHFPIFPHAKGLRFSTFNLFERSSAFLWTK